MLVSIQSILAVIGTIIITSNFYCRLLWFEKEKNYAVVNEQFYRFFLPRSNHRIQHIKYLENTQKTQRITLTDTCTYNHASNYSIEHR